MNIEINEAKQLVLRAGLELVAAGLIARTWGNVSCRINREQFAVTPSGRAYETLSPDDIVVCNIKDLKYKGNSKPSSEKGIHALLYAAGEEINFIIHTHQTMATAAGVLFETSKDNIAGMPVESGDAVFLSNTVPVAGYGLSGSKKLKTCVGAALAAGRGGKAIIMARHGALCFGKDMDEAFAAAHTLEEACTKYIGILDFTGSDFQKPEPEDYREGEELPAYIAEAIYAVRKDVKYISFDTTKQARWLSERPAKIRPLIDDFAQMIGEHVNIVDFPKNQKDIERLVEATGRQYAVLLKGRGALCLAPSQSDVRAVEMILQKGAVCQAAAEKFKHLKPLSRLDCKLMRAIYLKKYAKRK